LPILRLKKILKQCPEPPLKFGGHIVHQLYNNIYENQMFYSFNNYTRDILSCVICCCVLGCLPAGYTHSVEAGIPVRRPSSVARPWLSTWNSKNMLLITPQTLSRQNFLFASLSLLFNSFFCDGGYLHSLETFGKPKPIPTAPKSKNNNPATSGWRCHRRTADGDRVSATSPFPALGSIKRWDLWALPMSLLYVFDVQ
jgi:hypothetical protein